MSIKEQKNKFDYSYEVTIYLPQELQVKYSKKRLFKTFKNKKDAVKWEKRKKAEIKNGTLTFIENKTISEISNEYLDYSITNNRISPTTIPTYKGYIKNYFVPVFNDKYINDFSIVDLRNFKTFINNVKKTSKTKHNICTFLRSVIKYAFNNEYIDDNLVDYIPQFSQKITKERSFLTKNQIKLLIMEIEKEDVKDVIIFLVFTGLRISEVLGLRFCDIDFDNKMATINNQLIYIKNNNKIEYILKKPKNDYVSSILLNKISYHVLQKYYETKRPDLYDFVFTDNENKPYRKDGYLKYHLDFAVNNLKSKNVIEQNQSISFHCLRHSYGSLLAYNNEGIHNIQNLLRHQNFIVTYKHYIHKYPDYKPQSFKKIENDFQELLN